MTGLKKNFLSNESGNFGLTFAIGATLIFGVAGFAVHFSEANGQREHFRNTLDSAVLAAVAGDFDPKVVSGFTDAQLEAYKIEVAKKFFTANLPSYVDGMEATFHFENGIMHGFASGELETPLLNVIGYDKIPFSVESAASALFNYAEACVMAMHPTDKHTLELSGTVDVIGPDCHFYGNSNHIDDVVDPHSPENHLVGASVQAVGYGHHYIANVTPPLEHAPLLLADPLLSKKLPHFTGVCDYTKFKVEASTVTLKPGTYCDGLQIAKGATVTLNPGIYKIYGGNLTVSASTVTGDGVAIALVKKGQIKVEESVLRLSAPTSGDYKSMVLMASRDEESHVFKNSTIDLHGIVYVPNGRFSWTNKGTPTVTADWTTWIVEGFSWDGDGVINMPFDIKGSSVPYPNGMQIIPRPNPTPRLVY